MTSAAARAICTPTGIDPVNAIVCTPGCGTSAAPASPSPGSSEIADAGTPPARSAWTSIRAQPGDCSAGLSTTALPVASAAAVIPHGIATGKFQGAITATTPRGPYVISFRSPGTCNKCGPARELDRAAGIVLEEVDRLAHVGVGLGPGLRALTDLEGRELEPALAQPRRRPDQRRRPVLGADRAPVAKPALGLGDSVGDLRGGGAGGDRDDVVRLAGVGRVQLLADALARADHHRNVQRQRPGQAAEGLLELGAHGRSSQLEHRLVGERRKRWHLPATLTGRDQANLKVGALEVRTAEHGAPRPHDRAEAGDCISYCTGHPARGTARRPRRTAPPSTRSRGPHERVESESDFVGGVHWSLDAVRSLDLEARSS